MIRAKLCVCVKICVQLTSVCSSMYHNLQLEKVDLSAAQTLRAAFIKVNLPFASLLTLPRSFTFFLCKQLIAL